MGFLALFSAISVNGLALYFFWDATVNCPRLHSSPISISSVDVSQSMSSAIISYVFVSSVLHSNRCQVPYINVACLIYRSTCPVDSQTSSRVSKRVLKRPWYYFNV
ncbi:hypothetical protein F5J12DRAFT_368860 [Pisolithus orientalis]|uniref:uncharacterized protein n=1 Tax=Pisolithus orientalis TaxID=936130 RepID=UPI0022257700|nr:uncharacterized protein F5J12DRAFT_368860 [Pisolithus orientalis]KAI5995824.1 hypothetical protein F5J12DRAFT_368860 [Pisolithus orientalis]